VNGSGASAVTEQILSAILALRIPMPELVPQDPVEAVANNLQPVIDAQRRLMAR
jgi:hypothetical protein